MHAHTTTGKAVPTMGVFSGTAMVCGLMIGSGIFSTPGAVWELVGSPGMALTMWIIGGLVTYCGAFCYIELGTMLPRSGGEQVYLEYAFRKPRALFAFLFCMSMVFCIRPGSAAADSVIFGKYLVHAMIGPKENLPTDSIFRGDSGFGDGYDWTLRALGVICITSITALNVVSAKWAIRVHDALTSVKVLVLGVISITGLVVLFGGAPEQVSDPTQNWRSPFDGTKSDINSYASALFKIFWAYDGWSNLNLSVSELKNPQRNLPIAAGVGVTLVTALYLLANVAYLTVVPQQQAFASKEILAGNFFEIIFGEVAGRNVLPVFIALSAYGAVSAMVFSASRVVLVAAQQRYLPFGDTLGHINERFGTPVNALIFNWIWTTILMLVPPPGEAFSFLVDLVGYPSWLFYGISVAGLLYMRRTHRDKPRPFRVWPVAAVFFIIVSIFLSVFPFIPPSNDAAASHESSSIPYYLSATLGLILTILPVSLWWVQIANGGRVGCAFRRLTGKETEEDRNLRVWEHNEWLHRLDLDDDQLLDGGKLAPAHYEAKTPGWLINETVTTVC